MISIEPPKPWPYAAAILSGGQSKRMGVPKAGMVLPDGRSMIERIRDMLASFCHRVVLVGETYGLAGHQCLDDERTGRGPLAGIEALLSSGISPQYLVVACDQPLLPAGLLSRLMVGDDDGLTYFSDPTRDRIHPLPCRIGAECLDVVQSLLDQEKRSLHRLVAGLGPEALGVPLESRETDLLFNVNDPGDVARLFQMLRKGEDAPDGESG